MVNSSEFSAPITRPDLPRISSSESGFFFCGIRLEPLVTPSPSSIQRELFGRVKNPVLGQTAQVDHRHDAA